MRKEDIPKKEMDAFCDAVSKAKILNAALKVGFTPQQAEFFHGLVKYILDNQYE